MSVVNRFRTWVQSQLKQPIAQPTLRDPYYRFSSVEELRRAAASGGRIDVNRASIDDWLRLPGLSIHQARALVTLRQSGILFHGLEDVAAALSIPLQRLQPLAPILRFCYYDDTCLDQVSPIDPNLASLEQWMQIPQVNLALAQLILRERQQGEYLSLVDFQQRLQIAPSVIADLMHYLKFSGKPKI